MKLILSALILTGFVNVYCQDFAKDTFKTDKGDLSITFIGHGSLMFEFNKKVIHIDPSSREADYTKLPKADMVLITHHHGDHCDSKANDAISQPETSTFLTALAKEKLNKGKILNNGDKSKFDAIKIEAIPAYNLVHKRDNGEFFHPKGCCNSYLLTIGNKRIFIGGDTENTPEMKALKDIDIAFLPMNLPYTMTPEMVADAAKGFKPKILYPYHYGKTDVNALLKLMETEKSVEVRVRKM